MRGVWVPGMRGVWVPGMRGVWVPGMRGVWVPGMRGVWVPGMRQPLGSLHGYGTATSGESGYGTATSGESSSMCVCTAYQVLQSFGPRSPLLVLPIATPLHYILEEERKAWWHGKAPFMVAVSTPGVWVPGMRQPLALGSLGMIMWSTN